MSETTGFEPGNAKVGAVRAADDVNGMLQMLTLQIVDADRRHAAALTDMQSRLEGIGQAAEVARERAPHQYGPAFERIEDGVTQLAGRMAEVGRERDPSDRAVLQSNAAENRRPDARMPIDIGKTGAAEPWDQQSADALMRLYEGGHAEVEAATAFVRVNAALTSPSLPISTADADRSWLEDRFAAIAETVKKSLAEIHPESSFLALDNRLQQLERRFVTALEGVATRADVNGLRIVEAHINELTAQFELMRPKLGRLDIIEQQLGRVLTEVSGERLAAMLAPPSGAVELNEKTVITMAAAVADRIGAHLTAVRQLPSPETEATDFESGVRNLKQLIECFVADQREGDEHTASMLDTMQQAMIRLLDRMDAIEDAVPSVAPGMHNQQMRDGYADSPGYTNAGYPRSPEAVPESVRPSSVQVPPGSGQTRAELPSAPDQEPVQQQTKEVEPRPIAEPIDGNTKQDFVAAARRAARAASSRKAAEDQAADEWSQRTAAGKPLKVGPAAVVTRSRAPLIVAGIALVAAVGILAASVGMNRGLPFRFNTKVSGLDSKQVQSKPSPLQVEETASLRGKASAESTNGQDKFTTQKEAELTPDARSGARALTAVPPAQSDPYARLRTVPETGVDEMSNQKDGAEGLPVTQREVRLPGQGNASVTLAPAAEVTLGIAVMQTASMPTAQALVRSQQQRNMANLSSRLGAAQPALEFVPAALMPGGGTAVDANSAASEGRTINELPPATVGPMSLRTAAAKGDPSAEFEVAARFAEGMGMAQDFKQALIWYQRSAQRGFAPAQYRLGTLFERGIGTKPDMPRAKVWYGRAAEQGHVKAMHNLAVLSAARDQSTPDYEVAVMWFLAAAEFGLTDSQFNLGVLHESGLGLPRNISQAYLWLSLAARSGDKEAGRRRDAARAKLDEAEIRRLDEAVASWQAKPMQSMVNDPRAAGDAWKRRRTAGTLG